MFTKIEINYPEFGVEISREFTPGINVIEEPNGYGKSTILNTLLSLFSKKYPGLRTLPSGIAKIYEEGKVYMLSKGLWVGLERDPNDLIKYVLAGEFFSLSSPEQRNAIVRLLEIDMKAFMRETVPNWDENLEKTINANLKENSGKEAVILADIIRYKSTVLKFEKNPIVIEDNSQEIESKYAELLKKHNDRRFDIQKINNEGISAANSIRAQIAAYERRQEELRKLFTELSAGSCPTCGSKVEVSQAKIDEINAEGLDIQTKKEALQKKVVQEVITIDVPAMWPERNFEEKAAIVSIAPRKSSEEDIAAVREYENAKKELSIKEKMLKELGEIDDKTTLAAIKSRKQEFTKDLETKTKELGLEIELFKELANGETKESFVIMMDGKPYSELSGGNRLLVQLRMSLAFSKKLGLDFVLLDEAGLVSQGNFDLIKKECEGFQVIMARATPFSYKEEKPAKKKA